MAISTALQKALAENDAALKAERDARAKAWQISGTDDRRFVATIESCQLEQAEKKAKGL